MKPPLEVLVERWLASSVEGRESALTELSLTCCAKFGVPLDLRRVSQGISGVA